MTTLQGTLRLLSGCVEDAQGAANEWAGTDGLGFLGALNAKAGTWGVGVGEVLRLLNLTPTGVIVGDLGYPGFWDGY